MPRSDLTEPTPTGWRWHLARAVYGACHGLALPLLLPLVALHPRLRGRLGQRLGAVPRLAGEQRLWLHGSSAGDVVSLLPLVRRLDDHGVPLALSTWTRSGRQVARGQLPQGVPTFQTPLDMGWFVEATLDQLRPRGLVLECLEIWPALVAACHRRGIPVVVVNGRLSEVSLRGYRRLRWLFEPCFRSLSLVTALTGDDADRFERAGVPGRRISVLPSSKHGALGASRPPRRPRQKLVLGSLHRQEEQILLPWVARLAREQPDLELVLAPRYPHRAASLEQRLRGLGLTATLSSAAAGEGPGQVLVLDRMGELAAQYVDARVAFVGGSLVSRGGHNFLEPAACGVPVLVGPHTHNWQREAHLMEDAGGAAVVQDGRSFYGQARELLQDPQARATRGQAALLVARQLAGAADQTFQRLLQFLGSRA